MNSNLLMYNENVQKKILECFDPANRMIWEASISDGCSRELWPLLVRSGPLERMIVNLASEMNAIQQVSEEELAGDSAFGPTTPVNMKATAQISHDATRSCLHTSSILPARLRRTKVKGCAIDE